MTYSNFYNNLEVLNAKLKDLAFSLTNDMKAARVLYQETTFQVFKNRAKYQSETDLENWLLITMNHLHKNKFQRRAKQSTIYNYTYTQYNRITKKYRDITPTLAYA